MKTNVLLLDTYTDIENLVSVAFSFSEDVSAKLKIIYVFDFEWMRQSYVVGDGGTIDPSLFAIEHNFRQEYDAAEKKIEEVIADYKKSYKTNIEYEIVVSELNRIDVINDEWEKNNDLLLIVSTHQSYTDASGGLIGYPDILNHVKCPVLALSSDTKRLKLDTALYATDYHEEDIGALQHLHELIPEANITVMHVTKELEFDEKLRSLGFQETLKKDAGLTDIDFVLEENENIEEGLKKQLKEQSPDVIAVLKEKKGFFKQIFTSSETKNILTKFDKPVLIYHEK